MNYPKRLIEVDLPIKRISEHARREKSIRHGHISTLHIWWARRPLAACRAVICAALWPDPVDPLCPQAFRDRAAEIITDFAKQAVTNSELADSCAPDTWHKWQFLAKPENRIDSTQESHLNVLRNALLDFIADFANWDNSTNEAYLVASRALTQAAHEALGGEPGTRPLVVDPFAGGGAIPLEALRVGADAFASDLNPVAVLLNKVVLEYIPIYGQRLADEVRKWGDWVKREADKELAEFYPKDPDGATPIAYLWARTVLSEAPSQGNTPIEIPLLRSMRLNKHQALRWVRGTDGLVKTDLVTIEIRGEKRAVRRPILEIVDTTTELKIEDGTVRNGAATCPLTGYTTPATRVKAQLIDQHGGANNSRLIAVYVEGNGIRSFRLATKSDQRAFQAATRIKEKIYAENPDVFPVERINPIRPYKNTRGVSAVTRIGCLTFGDLYNHRQALGIHTFYKILNSVGFSEQSDDARFQIALRTLLALAVNRSVSQNTSVSRWDASRSTIKGAFSKQALAVVWDYAEANPFSGGSADWDGAVEWVVRFIESNASITVPGIIQQASAKQQSMPDDSVSALITDPPYFAAIPYADLSDFFYVWLRRALNQFYSDLFSSELVIKDEELIVTNAQTTSDGSLKDDSFFRKGMTVALDVARRAVLPSGIGVVVYAEGTTKGWEAILSAIIDAGWVITSSWPIDTEMENRTQAQGAASLQSSIHLVCRPRENPDGSLQANNIGDYRDVLDELPRRIREWMPRLAAEGVVGADAIFACLGPALEIFSRYARVEKVSGEHVLLHEYLEQVWAAVSKEALNMIFAGADATGFEADARLTAMWFWTLSTSNGSNTDKADVQPDDQEDSDDDEEQSDKTKKTTGYTLEFDAARKIAQGLGAHLEDLNAVVEIKGDKARLLPVAERSHFLFGKSEDGSPQQSRQRRKKKAQLEMFEGLRLDEDNGGVGDNLTLKAGATTLDRIHQSMLLFAAGRAEALKRFLVEDGVGRDQRFWRLADALSKLYPMSSDEKRWVDGVLARKKGLGF